MCSLILVIKTVLQRYFNSIMKLTVVEYKAFHIYNSGALQLYYIANHVVL